MVRAREAVFSGGFQRAAGLLLRASELVKIRRGWGQLNPHADGQASFFRRGDKRRAL